METIFQLPLDWDQWQKEWNAWLATHPQLKRTRQEIPGKNFLADLILGTFALPNGRKVELSEVTFPNLTERDPQTGVLLHYTVRAIGITWVDTREGNVVHSFAELEDELSLS